MTLQDEYRRALAELVSELVSRGHETLGAVLPKCEGAHPELVHEVLMAALEKNRKLTDASSKKDGRAVGDSLESLPRDKIAVRTTVSQQTDLTSPRHTFRSRVSEFFRQLPAPNPELCQWWFDVDTVDRLSTIVARARTPDRNSVLCLGAPTIAYGLALLSFDVTVLDNDDDVLALFSSAQVSEEVRSRVSAVSFDARTQCLSDVDIPLRTMHHVFLDPPWYREWFAAFLEHGIAALNIDGHLFTTLLPRLTRASAERDRVDVIAAISQHGFEVLAVERGQLGYAVPQFEQATYSQLNGFDGVPWRYGDLLHARLTTTPASSTAPLSDALW